MTDHAFLGQLITFLTVIIGFGVQYLREARQHRWDAEQRMAVAADLRLHTAAAAAELAAAQLASEGRLTQHIETNTEVSVKAFKEANDVNNKIHALGIARDIADFVSPKHD